MKKPTLKLVKSNTKCVTFNFVLPSSTKVSIKYIFNFVLLLTHFDVIFFMWHHFFSKSYVYAKKLIFNKIKKIDIND